MARQWVEVQFPNSPREYCYHWDGAPLTIGEKVDVETARGEVTVTVVWICESAPPFETKPILRRTAPPEAGVA